MAVTSEITVCTHTHNSPSNSNSTRSSAAANASPSSSPNNNSTTATTPASGGGVGCSGGRGDGRSRGVGAEDPVSCFPANPRANQFFRACVKLGLKVRVGVLYRDCVACGQCYRFLHQCPYKEDTYVALRDGCRTGNTPLVERLLKHKSSDVNINRPDNCHMSPLVNAVECCGVSTHAHTEVVKALLAHPKIEINHCRPYCPPLYSSVNEKYPMSVFWLLIRRHDIDVNIVTSVSHGVLKSGRTTVWRACRFGPQWAVRPLLRHPRIDINIMDYNEVSPLVAATKVNQANGSSQSEGSESGRRGRGPGPDISVVAILLRMLPEARRAAVMTHRSNIFAHSSLACHADHPRTRVHRIGARKGWKRCHAKFCIEQTAVAVGDGNKVGGVAAGQPISAISNSGPIRYENESSRYIARMARMTA